MFKVAKSQGARAVNTASLSTEVSGMLESLGGVKLPGDHYAVAIESSGGPECQQQ
jgi:hypothetical protein